MANERKYPGSLHNHTQYSNARLRDCIIKEDDLIKYATANTGTTKNYDDLVKYITTHDTRNKEVYEYIIENKL